MVWQQGEGENLTELSTVLPGGARPQQQEEDEVDTVAEYVVVNLWFYWREIVFISLVTAAMMNLLITRPLVARMREQFQERSRELVDHFTRQQRAVVAGAVAAQAERVKVVTVEVPVPGPGTASNNFPQTPSTESQPSLGSAASLHSSPSTEFSSRFLSDFQPVQVCQL